MRRAYVTALLVLSIVGVPTSSAFAQVIFGPGLSRGDTTPLPGSANQGGIDGAKVCQGAPGGSRVRAACDDMVPTRTETVRAEYKLPPPPPRATGPVCEASTLTEYSQEGNIAHIAGTVSIANCPAGTAGAFNLVARVKDESGEVTPLEFSEAWERDDARDVSFNGDYPIGDDVELVNVRVRNLVCSCAQTAAADIEPPELVPPAFTPQQTPPPEAEPAN